MTILISEKREIFVLNTYREKLSHRRKNISHLRHLAKKFGPFSYLEKKDKTIKAVLSQDSGYLFAETVLEYLKIDTQPWVVYLEESVANKSIAMVVVKQHEVTADMLVPIDHVERVLEEMSREIHPYQFHIVDLKSSSVDLVSMVQKQFCKKSSKCKIKKYTESVINQISEQKKYKLHTIEDEIKLKKLNKFNYNILFLPAFIISVFYIFHYHNQRMAAEQEELMKEYHHNSRLRAAFNLPSAKKIMREIRKRLIKVHYISGWPVTHLVYTPQKLVLTVETSSLRDKYLEKWTEEENIIYNAKNHQLTFSLASLESKLTLKPMDTMEDLEKELMEKLRKVIPSDTIKKGEIKDNGLYKTMNIDISIKNRSILFLKVIAKIIGRLPVKIKNIKLSIDNSIITGTLTIELRGA